MCQKRSGRPKSRALANSVGLLAFKVWSCRPKDLAATCTSFKYKVAPGLEGLNKTATCEILGMVSLRISRRLPLSSGESRVSPVMFPPGRASVLTSPAPRGSPLTAMTIGIVLVALCAACAPGVVAATMMSTLSFTSSAARSGYRSSFPCAHRHVLTLHVSQLLQPFAENQDGRREFR